MKKIFFLFLSLSIFAGASRAQQTSPVKETRKEQLEKRKEDLKLSAEQDAKWNDITAQFKNKSKVIRRNDALAAEEKKKQLRSTNKEKMHELYAMLTPDQRQKFSRMKKEAHRRKGAGTDPVSK